MNLNKPGEAFGPPKPFTATSLRPIRSSAAMRRWYGFFTNKGYRGHSSDLRFTKSDLLKKTLRITHWRWSQEKKHLSYEKNPSFFAWPLIAPHHGIVLEPASHPLFLSHQREQKGRVFILHSMSRMKTRPLWIFEPSDSVLGHFYCTERDYCNQTSASFSQLSHAR